MRLNFGCRFDGVSITNGYGYATTKLMETLNDLGHEASFNDSAAPVQIWFDQPWAYEWIPGAYRIAYHPWESSAVGPVWYEKLAEADEIWTPNQLMKTWYEAMGLKNVYVFHHGIEDAWSPKKRILDGPVKFFHHGGEALRKGFPMTMDAFRAAFPGKEDVRLVIKQVNPGFQIPTFGRYEVHTSKISLEELIALYHSANVMVYPSWGEGFGFAPLQAIATGMPTITTTPWCEYVDLVLHDLRLNSTLAGSPWPGIHPGLMYQPDFDDLVDKMRYVYDNYEDIWYRSFYVADAVHEQWNWKRKVSEFFSDFEARNS